MNRQRTRGLLEWLSLYVLGMILVAALMLVFEFTHRVFLHLAVSYRSICILTPVVLAIASRTTRLRWAATIVAGVYTAFVLGMLWILPLFPAQPKLGPVLHEVTQFIPGGFPLLIMVPAFVLDLLWPRMADWSRWQQSLVLGSLFFVVLVAVEWPFADFLQSPAARNAFFGSAYLDYNQSPQSYAATYRFLPPESASGVSHRHADRARMLGGFDVGRDGRWRLAEACAALELCCCVGFWPLARLAHVGSPDVFFQGKAGPYPLLVAIRPPDVIPGVARIEVRVEAADVDEVDLTPTPMTGIAATHPPIADVARRAVGDPQYFEGSLWLMSSGSWEVHIRVQGKSGSGELPVPVPAVALKMKPMGKGVSAFLFGMMLFLSAGMVAIVRAAAETHKKSATVVASLLVGTGFVGRLGMVGQRCDRGGTKDLQALEHLGHARWRPAGVEARRSGLAAVAQARRPCARPWTSHAPVSGAMAGDGSCVSSASGTDCNRLLRDCCSFDPSRDLSDLRRHRA